MSAMYGGDEVSAIVLDMGSYSTKGGYAGEDTPKAIFPTSVGVVYEGKDGVVGQGPREVGDEADRDAPATRLFYVGNSSVEYRRNHMHVTSPFSKGLVTDWDVVEQLWDHAFKTRLLINPQEHPILLGEQTFNPSPLRMKSCELMFEKYQVPALFVAKNPVLAAFSSGKATALVLDSGGGVTSAVPVHEGYALQKCVVKSTLAGEVLTAHTHQILAARNIHVRPQYCFTKKEVRPHEWLVTEKVLPHTTPSYHAYMTSNALRDIKESMCRVADSYDDGSSSQVPYELPDGQTIELSSERYRVAEPLFNPTLLGPLYNASDMPNIGIHQMVYDSVSNCDVDIRRDMFGSVVLTGGTTLFAGLAERLTKELQEICPQAMKLKVVASSLSPQTKAERRFAVWIGGSILGSLGSFQQMWMSKSEYEEHGAGLVDRKCP
eukprot:gnl/Hemi2/26572_TR8927_c0_g4_i1.p1 gnl/Hemi2/26572_TR8927_c0_g4~~gnl/Hemi2/26572_TR8927_c0_g4_i1.p1  ORF type:complete len:434 (-),score=92.05 gnl/Hemi2/26572_TR8927_c0_g4_i1:68-1369(-)